MMNQRRSGGRVGGRKMGCKSIVFHPYKDMRLWDGEVMSL